jgi:hypothetical protein
MITPRQLEILQHSLGLNKYGQGESYRNHFCAGGDDVLNCAELVALGLMQTFTRSYLPYFNCTVTDAGKLIVESQSPKAPILTKGQKRYREFLKVDTGESFGTWLKDH